MVKYIIGVLLFTLVVSCKNSNKQTGEIVLNTEIQDEDTFKTLQLERVIDNYNTFHNEKLCYLSSVADSITYIVLGSKNDKGEEVYLGRVMQTIVGSKYIVLNCMQAVFLFDKSGKFIRKVGQRGQGPGDYVMVPNIDVNEETDRIYINNSGKTMLVYNFQGNFIQSIPFNDADYFAVLDNNEYALSFDNLSGNVPYRMIIQNENSDTIAAFKNNVKFESKSELFFVFSNLEQRFYKYKGNVYYRENYNDTICRIKNNELIPRYFVNLGKYHAPVNARVEFLKTNAEREQISSKYYTFSLIESTKSLFIHYRSLFQDSEKSINNGYVYYDKKTDQYNSILPPSYNRSLVFGGGFENDIDGGSLFLPEGVTLDGKSLFSTYNAANFKDKIEKAGYYDNIKYPEKQKALKKMVDSIDESTNIVIMVATLK